MKTTMYIKVKTFSDKRFTKTQKRHLNLKTKVQQKFNDNIYILKKQKALYLLKVL